MEEDILNSDNTLFSHIDKFGVRETLDFMQALEEKNLSLSGVCHARSHILGIYAYQKFGTDAFFMCDEKCGGGCYHGAIGAYAQKHGNENFAESLKTACRDKDALDEFDSENQCVHGLGHGILAWHNYELFEALKTCEQVFVGDDWKAMECWRGVFMENVVGTHMPRKDYSKFLSDDPAYPCTIVPEKYKNACWQFVSFRAGALYGNDFEKIIESCEKVPQPFNRACFGSLGMNAVKFYKGNPMLAEAVCLRAPIGVPQDMCFYGIKNWAK